MWVYRHFEEAARGGVHLPKPQCSNGAWSVLKRKPRDSSIGFVDNLLPIGPIVAPFWGSYLEFYKVIPKRNYYGAYG